MKRALAVLIALPVLVSCQEQPTVLSPDGDASFSRAGPGRPTTAVVRFGDPRAGSPFPPQAEHDASFHAEDKMVPRTVVVPVGGTVTFEVPAIHIVAIYQDGTSPSDIDLSAVDDITVPFPPFTLPGFLIDDANGRIAFQGVADLLSHRTFEHTFTAPGRYLVICAFTPHFVAGDMYGWVIVK